MTERYQVFVTAAHVGQAVSFLQQHFSVEAADSTVPMSYEELRSKLNGCDAVVTTIEDRIDEEILNAHPQLKVVANVAVGYDNIDVAAAGRAGVLVCNTPGVLDNATADLAFALLLASARRIAESDRYVRNGQWQRWSTDLFLGGDVSGKTLGILGLGRIGKAMARRARGFDCRLLYWQRNQLAAHEEAALAVEYVPLEELLKQSDFVSVHCPLTAQTRHLLGAAQFALMKRSAILINTARGAIIDETALVAALNNKVIAAAGLDVFENEPAVPEALLTMPNVVITPHIGSATVETRAAMAMSAARAVEAAFHERLPENCVNPQVWPAFSARVKGQLAGRVDE